MMVKFYAALFAAAAIVLHPQAIHLSSTEPAVEGIRQEQMAVQTEATLALYQSPLEVKRVTVSKLNDPDSFITFLNDFFIGQIDDKERGVDDLVSAEDMEAMFKKLETDQGLDYKEDKDDYSTWDPTQMPPDRNMKKMLGFNNDVKKKLSMYKQHVEKRENEGGYEKYLIRFVKLIRNLTKMDGGLEVYNAYRAKLVAKAPKKEKVNVDAVEQARIAQWEFEKKSIAKEEAKVAKEKEDAKKAKEKEDAKQATQPPQTDAEKLATLTKDLNTKKAEMSKVEKDLMTKQDKTKQDAMNTLTNEITDMQKEVSVLKKKLK